MICVVLTSWFRTMYCLSFSKRLLLLSVVRSCANMYVFFFGSNRFSKRGQPMRLRTVASICCLSRTISCALCRFPVVSVTFP